MNYCKTKMIILLLFSVSFVLFLLSDDIEFANTQAHFKNNVLIGFYAGYDLPKSSQNVVIIGDGIRNLDKSKENVLFIGDNVAIGDTVFGEEINLKKAILKLKQI